MTGGPASHSRRQSSAVSPAGWRGRELGTATGAVRLATRGTSVLLLVPGSEREGAGSGFPFGSPPLILIFRRKRRPMSTRLGASCGRFLAALPVGPMARAAVCGVVASWSRQKLRVSHSPNASSQHAAAGDKASSSGRRRISRAHACAVHLAATQKTLEWAESEEGGAERGGWKAARAAAEHSNECKRLPPRAGRQVKGVLPSYMERKACRGEWRRGRWCPSRSHFPGISSPVHAFFSCVALRAR